MATQEKRRSERLVPAARPRAQERPGVADRAARTAALAVLRRMRRGELVLVDGGQTLRFGSSGGATPLRATVTVRHPGFYRALLRGGSRALALSYIDGEWDCDDTFSLTRIACLNLRTIDALTTTVVPLLAPLQRGLRWFDRNTPARSVQRVRQHYDLGNDFYALMLDPTMMYSCGLYADPAMSLHEAQVAKLERVCQWLRLTPDDHVLEIGTGWGGLAVHAAQRYGCRVTTTTISREQHAHAVRRVADAGLRGRVTVLLEDYRDLRGRYDKLVSIEMIEAVGAHYFDSYFAACSRLLEPDGLMFLQAIVTSHRLYRSTRFGRGFANDVIFPGGCLPSNTAMLDCVGRVTDMRLVDFEDITPGYPPTLLAWRHNVDAHAERIRGLGFDERFLRMWRLYLSFCAGAFAERRINDVQLLLAKPTYRDEEVRRG
ncbi:MAG TPA: cyclopropane-fatty-acyl-phospholipid synthase family protein [Candidatus Angelobacter sp.]|jgi:cyclopropane-fatty-acyl-phospholipid synthase|nr:cyclopropane-fatty-acyl-phospholipid synthase family protein [Candidatus Angelobacter sp.]